VLRGVTVKMNPLEPMDGGGTTLDIKTVRSDSKVEIWSSERRRRVDGNCARHDSASEGLGSVTTFVSNTSPTKAVLLSKKFGKAILPSSAACASKSRAVYVSTLYVSTGARNVTTVVRFAPADVLLLTTTSTDTAESA
jgi:hypothetical protein